MKKSFTLGILVLTTFYFSYGQKDCSFDHTGKIPINDLAGGYFNGFAGGLYPDGTNTRPPGHLAKCIEHVSQIQPLDVDGSPSPSGKIVMMGIGASNPMTEFNKFKEISEYFEPLNDNLEIVNACVGGVAIQKMYEETDTYWLGVENLLEDAGLSALQVQVIWVEQENTNSYDTAFNSATIGLVTDFLTLLRVFKDKFPNAQICYVSARAYAGYADPIDPDISKGLLYPRDYFNGWALKRLVENAINAEEDYDFDGPDAEIPLITWGTYHWTDGSTPRMDGLFLDCEEDLSPDGLHLAGPGEQKIGTFMFDYFKTDTTAKYWFYDEAYSGIINNPVSKNTIQIYPNPVNGNTINFYAGTFDNYENIQYQICDAAGKIISKGIGYGKDNITIQLQDIAPGAYYITAIGQQNIATGSFIVTQ